MPVSFEREGGVNWLKFWLSLLVICCLIRTAKANDGIAAIAAVIFLYLLSVTDSDPKK